MAFKEQTKMNLDWYNGIEPILSVDPAFDMDHVTAYNHRKNKTTKSHHQTAPYNFLFHKGIKQTIPQQSVINPNQSKFFIPFIILKKLKQNFKTSWHSGLNSSSKLDTYCTIKSNFEKEPYLDIVKTYSDRTSMTRLRISAHNLEVEMGRRTKIPRTDRICKWCNLSLGSKTIENENHVINDCDLYAKPRRNLLHKLANLLTDTPSQHLTKNILSGPVITNTQHPNYENQCHHLRLIARYVNRCFSLRQKFLTS